MAQTTDCSCLQEASDFPVDEYRCFNHSVAALAVTSTAEIAVVVADFHSIVTGGVWLVQGTGRVERAPKIVEAMLAAEAQFSTDESDGDLEVIFCGGGKEVR